MGTSQLRLSSSKSESRSQASKLVHLRYLLQSRKTAKQGRDVQKGKQDLPPKTTVPTEKHYGKFKRETANSARMRRNLRQLTG